MSSNLSTIQADIAHAREWARKHFNAYVDEEMTPSHALAPPTMLLTFPEPDTMIVRPVFYGKSFEMYTAAEYKLCWKGDGLIWKGNFVVRKQLFGEGDIAELRVICPPLS